MPKLPKGYYVVVVLPSKRQRVILSFACGRDREDFLKALNKAQEAREHGTVRIDLWSFKD